MGAGFGKSRTRLRASFRVDMRHDEYCEEYRQQSRDQYYDHKRNRWPESLSGNDVNADQQNDESDKSHHSRNKPKSCNEPEFLRLSSDCGFGVVKQAFDPVLCSIEECLQPEQAEEPSQLSFCSEQSSQ